MGQGWGWGGGFSGGTELTGVECLARRSLLDWAGNVPQIHVHLEPQIVMDLEIRSLQM